MGYKVAVKPSVLIVHMEGLSIKKSLGSWKKRELLLENSAVIYMDEERKSNIVINSLYRLVDRLFLPERYCFYKLKHRGAKQEK